MLGEFSQIEYDSFLNHYIKNLAVLEFFQGWALKAVGYNFMFSNCL